MQHLKQIRPEEERQIVKKSDKNDLQTATTTTAALSPNIMEALGAQLEGQEENKENHYNIEETKMKPGSGQVIETLTSS